jgi:hypothetical protein
MELKDSSETCWQAYFKPQSHIRTTRLCGLTYKVLCVVSPPPSIGITLSDWFGGEHHAKNPLDETAGDLNRADYMGIESRLQCCWK